MVGDRLVEGRADHFRLDRAVHVGHFFRPLADQGHHQVHLGVVVADRVGHVLEDRGLTGLGRADDQAALALADGRDQVEQPGAEHARRGFQVVALFGENRGQALEVRPRLGEFRAAAVDGLHPQQPEVLL